LGKEKHPLVVGIMGLNEKGYDWNVYIQTVSSCGAYFVCMDRHKRDESQWADDALCAYEYLAKNYAVDTNKVYLMGVSAGAGSVDSLLQTKPELWKGAIYYNGGQLAYYPGLRTSKILLDAPGDDIPEADRQRFYQSQDPLAAAGIRPILIFRPGIGHLSASMAVGKERLLKLGPFIQQP
jgi:dienelactone hydrolase